VSPLTTLVQQKVAAGATVDSAESAVKNLLGITDTTVSLFSDYIAGKGSATQADATSASRYARAHEAAKVVAKSLQSGYDGLKSDSNAKAVQKVLLAQAEDALTVQKATSADTTNPTFTTMRRCRRGQPQHAEDRRLRKGQHRRRHPGSQHHVRCHRWWSGGLLRRSLTGLGTKATAGQVKDLRFYVTNVLLIDAQGNTVPVTLDANANQARDVALIDFEDATGKCPTSTGSAATPPSPARSPRAPTWALP
jgi:hypothetical protein